MKGHPICSAWGRLWPAAALMVALLLPACAGDNSPTRAPTAPTARSAPLAEATPTLSITDIAPTLTPPGQAVAVLDTPEPGIPVTGTEQKPTPTAPACAPHRLSDMLTYTLYDRASRPAGIVEALVIFLPSNDEQAPALAGPQTALTDDNTAAPSPLRAPRIVYAVTDLEDDSPLNDQDVLVPFGLLAFPPQADGVESGGVGCGFILAVEREVMENAPPIDNNAWQSDAFGLSRADWDSPYRRYWRGQGFPPFDEPGRPVILSGPVFFAGSPKYLALVNPDDSQLGEVVDFTVDPQTNLLEYAIVSAGGLLGTRERYLPLPIRLLRWEAVAGYANAGSSQSSDRLRVDVPSAILTGAPSFDNLSVFDEPAGTWRSPVEAFWDGLTWP